MNNVENCIMVSIICTAYNHEKYIQKALDGFVMQETNFKYEIIIHDDASNDKTVEIIHEYEAKYPDIIIPIYQVENQYSKGVDIILDYMFPKARGKYIALCESDDYWTDPLKLQKQVDYMTDNPDCTLVVHDSIKVNENGEYVSDYYSQKSGDYDIDANTMITSLNMFPFNSMLMPKKLFETVPDFFYTSDVSDFVFKIYLSLNGRVHHLPENMSAYRMASSGSWTERIAQDSVKCIKHIENTIETLKKMNEYSNYKNNQAFVDEILKREFHMLLLQKDIKKAKSSRYILLYRRMSGKEKIKLFIDKYFPGLIIFVKKR